MKVGIIGAGNVGKALAGSIARAGHDVTITARDPEQAREAARDTGAHPVEGNVTTARDAEVVILAVPYPALGEVASEIGEVTTDKTIIDVTNPLKPDLSGVATADISAAEELQRQLPDAHVVKAFNTIFASNQADPDDDIDAFIAADDGKAKEQVMSLVDSLGFSPLDVGGLAAARHLEWMAFLNIKLNASNGWDWSSAWKLDR